MSAGPKLNAREETYDNTITEKLDFHSRGHLGLLILQHEAGQPPLRDPAELVNAKGGYGALSWAE